jgi:hypothetical protein
MAFKHARPSRGQKIASWAVMAALAAVAVWLHARQAVMNPAVDVALRPPALAGSVRPAGVRAFASAAFLEAPTGTVPAGPVESYDPDTLSDRIDGKAELYLAAHFQEMSCRAFTAPDGARVQAYVYAMATPRDAFAVLSSQRRPGAAPSGLSPEAYQTDNALFFTKGRHYVELVADRGGPETLAGLSALGMALVGLLPGDDTAGGREAQTETALFPTDGLDAATVRLAASDAMGMAGFSNVYTADYALPDGLATAFLAVRDTPEAAAADALAFAAFLTQNGYAPVEAAGSPEGTTVLGLDGSFEIIFTRDRTLAGVHDAASLPAALDLAARLRRALEGKKP